ncbi:hypothetical protein LHYA1_G008284 [Lachnellula hyalina]|uniref:Erythromycin esterase n=1 Tax=Lachnellula hyalina TaxID=1316788 RepID=A0A8H8TW19_9HELO|nr:uncharacterized protein LHYA1_G008284 [Lachnellula hyalina]TVY22825.1 hypothetical protein LHYA1_G008284 [Lachnellula hyalina]
MARRSSRLRGNTPTQPNNYASNHLESLTERDETPTDIAWPSLDTLASSPPAPRTPVTATRPKPTAAEMHPSKAHQSTTQKPDSGLRLGFTDIKAAGNGQPSGVAQQSPSRIGISTPSFDFRFARPGPTLGPEAQQMMDELREEALRIKVKLAAEKEEQRHRSGEGAAVLGRKIAQPKGKVGRYSDVHLEQFKKMDSIADHPSSFRAQPGRFTPTTTSLKRTQSKAKLDEAEDIPSKIASPTKTNDSARVENTAPAKRARRTINDDTSAARPVSRDTPAKPTTPGIPRSQSGFLAAITTPTQSSLARAAGAKTPSTQIPTLSRSPSKPSLIGTPRTLPKSATTTNLKSESRGFLRSPSKFDRVKSLFRQASSSMKKPTVKPSSIPSLTRSPSKPNLDRALPSVPTTPIKSVASKPVKHVNFTPDTANKNANTFQNSPSPVKPGLPRSASRIILNPKSPHTKMKAKEAQYPEIAGNSNIASHSREVEYPSLAGVRQLPAAMRSGPTPHPPPSVPGTFTFRSDHTIDFGVSPKRFGSSPGQASVRQVRQSIVPNIPGSFPSSNKENDRALPSVPHGMSNKKRRRITSDDETEDDLDHSPKKRKAAAAEGPMLMAPRLHATPKSRLNSPSKSPAKKAGFLSMSRLNMLSQPKDRK